MTTTPDHSAATPPQGRTAARSAGRQAGSEESQGRGCARPAPEGLASTALQLFHQRQRYWQRRRAGGQCTAEEADAQLHPWLAIALIAGADPAALHPQAAVAVADRQGGACNVSPAMAAALVADDHCPRAEALAVLANSRDAALDQLARLSQDAVSAAMRPQGRTAARSAGRQAESEESQAADAAPAPEAIKIAKRATDQAAQLATLAHHLHAPAYQGSAFARKEAA